MYASPMARGVLHADAVLPPERRVAIYILVMLISEIRDAAIQDETVGDVVRRPKINPRIAWIHNLAWIVIVGASPSEISIDVPVHPPNGSIEHDISGVRRSAQQRAAH